MNLSKSLKPLEDLFLLVYRIGISLSLMTHGFPKFQRLLNGDMKFGNPIGIGETPTFILAVLTEFIAPLLIILGFFSRVSAFFTMCTMFVIFMVVHGQDAYGDKEIAAIYFLAFAVLLFLGPGKYSIGSKSAKAN
jgi:putative oxidoreductase